MASVPIHLTIVALLSALCVDKLALGAGITASYSSDSTTPLFGQLPTQHSQFSFDPLKGTFDFKNPQLTDLFGPALKLAAPFSGSPASKLGFLPFDLPFANLQPQPQPTIHTGKTSQAAVIPSTKTGEQQTQQFQQQVLEQPQQQQPLGDQHAQQGDAMVGVDANILEQLGGAKIVKGGLLLGAAGAKKAIATAKAGIVGKKVASIVEIPLKVVALKDIIAGKKLLAAGKLLDLKKDMFGNKFNPQQSPIANQDQGPVQQQPIKGSEIAVPSRPTPFGGLGVNPMDFGQVANQAATMVRLMPLVLENFQAPDFKKQSDNTNQLLNGLSVFPSVSQPTVANQQSQSVPNLAAIINPTHPLLGMLSNPGLKPFLMPIDKSNKKNPLNFFDMLKPQKKFNDRQPISQPPVTKTNIQPIVEQQPQQQPSEPVEQSQQQPVQVSPPVQQPVSVQQPAQQQSDLVQPEQQQQPQQQLQQLPTQQSPAN